MSADSEAKASVPKETEFPQGGGELGALVRRFDWSRTPLGPIDAWPQSLKTVVGLILNSALPRALLWGPDGVMIYNDAFSVIAADRHPAALGLPVRQSWPEMAGFNDRMLKTVLGGQTQSFHDLEFTFYREGAAEQVTLDLDYTPVPDESGRPAGVLAVVFETGKTVRAEARERVRQSEDRFRALVSATSDVVYRMSADWTLMKALEGRDFLSDTDAPSIRWRDVYLLPEDQAAIQQVIDEAIRTKSVFRLEHRVRRADGSIGWTSSRAIPLLDADGEITEWFGAASDITARRKAEQHLRLVINELNHRVKNNLAMTQAVAAQTFRNALSVTEAQASLSSRISALALANDLLTGERGAEVSMSGVLEQATRPHCPSPERRLIEGPEFVLSPKSALSLSLAMHELSTNALKYGAWSTHEGEVSIRWSTYWPGGDGAERLQLVWTERGGPAVEAPHRRGFGSRLIERGLAGELGGEVEMRFEPDGLVCVIDAPLTVYAEGES